MSTSLGPLFWNSKVNFVKSLLPDVTAGERHWHANQHINVDHEEAYAYFCGFGPEIAFRQYLLNEQNVVCYGKETSKAK